MALPRLSLLRLVRYRCLLSGPRSSLPARVVLPPVLQNSWTPVSVLPLARHYAKKSKGKGQQTRLNISNELVEDILNLEEVKEAMAAVLVSLKEDFSCSLSIRTSPGALDHIMVTTKNGKIPLKQLGQISMKSPQLILVNMTGFPEVTAAAARALRESSMRLNPDVIGAVIRVPVPMVTREHRENLCKLAKEFSHKAKESLRKVRAGAVGKLKKSKEGISEDTVRLIEKQVQQMTDDFTADIDRQLAAKTKELLG